MAVVAPGLSDKELVELLEVLGGSDSVELKLTVPHEAQRAAVIALGLDPLDAQVRMVYFFDTPELALDTQGLVVRARRVQGRGDDSVVKLRPCRPDELPDDLRESRDFVVEVDVTPDGHVCSGTLKGTPKKAGVREAAAGEAPLRRLFSKQQRAFYARHAPEGIGLDDLSLLGPIFVLKLKGVPDGFDRKMVAEMWLYPDGSRVLELSTKCAPSEAFQVAAESRAFLAGSGIATAGEQTMKTRKTLDFFSAELRA